MSDFMAKMHTIRFPLGLRPRLRWGSLQHSLRLPNWIKGKERDMEKARGREEGKGAEGANPPAKFANPSP